MLWGQRWKRGRCVWELVTARTCARNVWVKRDNPPSSLFHKQQTPTEAGRALWAEPRGWRESSEGRSSKCQSPDSLTPLFPSQRRLVKVWRSNEWMWTLACSDSVTRWTDGLIEAWLPPSRGRRELCPREPLPFPLRAGQLPRGSATGRAGSR